MERDILLKDIRAFIDAEKQKLGAVGTTGPKGPEVAFVYYAVDDELNVYFVTRMGSRKYQNILRDQNVAFSIAVETPPKTLQVEGVASLVSNPEAQRTLFPKLVELATSRNCMPPIAQEFDTSEIAFIKVAPRWARFGDFQIPHTDGIFREVFW